jgi:hypothetical protein
MKCIILLQDQVAAAATVVATMADDRWQQPK